MATTIAGEPKKDVHYLGSLFAVTIDGISATSIFTEVSGLSYEVSFTDVTTSTAAGAQLTRKRPAKAKYGDITLKRTFAGDKTFWKWLDDASKGKTPYKHDGKIALFNRAGEEIGKWTFLNAWPSKWSITDLDVGQDDLVTESITLAIEGLKREV